MKIIFLGTSAARPTARRNLTCICIEMENNIFMFDVGEGAQLTYFKSGLKWNKEMKIFITHLHGDHCIGILGLLQTMSIQQRSRPIEIYGPDGIVDFIIENMKILNFNLSYPVFITIVSEGLIVDEKKYRIYSCKAKHSVTSFSYMLKEKDRPGKFIPEKAKSLGIPKGVMWKHLQIGKKVSIGNKIILPSYVIGKKIRGKTIGISGDTRPTKKLELFFNDCDYLSFDSTFLHGMKDKAIKTKHSTAKEAANLAKKANVANLILTHFSTRHTNETIFMDEAKKTHKSVIVAKDLLEILVE